MTHAHFRLVLVILEIFSNLHDSMILYHLLYENAHTEGTKLHFYGGTTSRKVLLKQRI